jgi:carboxypeptidase C (cathepsin A)
MIGFLNNSITFKKIQGLSSPFFFFFSRSTHLSWLTFLEVNKRVCQQVYKQAQLDYLDMEIFIRLYTTRYQRWASPKFLIGESYDTTRAAGLSGYLQERHGMYINGIMLVSIVLNFQTTSFIPGNDLPYILFLPTYTATAYYHGRLPDDLQRDLRTALKEAEEFATGEYTLGLMLPKFYEKR